MGFDVQHLGLSLRSSSCIETVAAAYTILRQVCLKKIILFPLMLNLMFWLSAIAHLQSLSMSRYGLVLLRLPYCKHDRLDRLTSR